VEAYFEEVMRRATDAAHDVLLSAVKDRLAER